jgi:hypothetical protein
MVWHKNVKGEITFRPLDIKDTNANIENLKCKNKNF